MGRIIAVDLDGTLARETDGRPSLHIGDPIPEMVAFVKSCLDAGVDVWIFTARRLDIEMHHRLDVWCERYIGRTLKVTNRKQGFFDAIYDDRAHRIERNTGRELCCTKDLETN